MSRIDAAESRTVALYWDFENIHAGLCDEREPGSYARNDTRFKPQDPLVNVQAIVDLAASFGPISINRAYCNWQYFSRYRDTLLQNAVELVQLFPPGSGAKNGADIKLCLDATEDIGRFGHIGTVIIVGGDSDFMPLSQKVKAAGRTLVGIGTRKATNRHWARSCHEFRYYESLLEVPDAQPGAASAAAPEPGPQPGAEAEAAPGTALPDAPFPSLAAEAGAAASPAAADLVRRALRLLAHKHGDAWVNKGEVWPMVKRLDPTFGLADHGFGSFAGMLKSMDSMLEVRKGERDQQLRLRDPSKPPHPAEAGA